MERKKKPAQWYPPMANIYFGLTFQEIEYTGKSENLCPKTYLCNILKNRSDCGMAAIAPFFQRGWTVLMTPPHRPEMTLNNPKLTKKSPFPTHFTCFRPKHPSPSLCLSIIPTKTQPSKFSTRCAIPVAELQFGPNLKTHFDRRAARKEEGSLRLKNTVFVYATVYNLDECPTPLDKSHPDSSDNLPPSESINKSPSEKWWLDVFRTKDDQLRKLYEHNPSRDAGKIREGEEWKSMHISGWKLLWVHLFYERVNMKVFRVEVRWTFFGLSPVLPPFFSTVYLSPFFSLRFLVPVFWSPFFSPFFFDFWPVVVWKLCYHPFYLSFCTAVVTLIMYLCAQAVPDAIADEIENVLNTTADLAIGLSPSNWATNHSYSHE